MLRHRFCAASIVGQWRASSLVAVALLAAAIACSGPSAEDGNGPRAVVAAGEWAGGPWRLVDMAEPGSDDHCLNLEPVADPGCTPVSSLKATGVKAMQEGGAPAREEMPAYRYIVLVGPPDSLVSAQVRFREGAPVEVPVTELPGTRLRAAIYVAERDEFEQADLVVRDANGQWHEPSLN